MLKPPNKSAGVPLSALLDGDSGESANNDNGASDADSQSDEGPSDMEEDDEDVLSPSDNEDIDVEGDALKKLGSFIDDLSLRKRKASDVTDLLPARAIKRRVIPERTEAAIEGEFAAPSGMHAGKLTLEELLKPSSASGNNISSVSLAKSAQLLSSANNQPLSPPLHQRQQDRVDREAAYEATTEEVQKWAPTMKRIKEAEHLSFPLRAPPVLNTSASELASKFKPSTELESAVDKLLKVSNLEEEDIEQTEQLQMSNLTIEEVAARRAELRQMWELTFRAEAKAKRISKIKSKTFRKIQKKGREKNALTLDQIRVLDPEAADTERLKLEAARAKERATLRHKNTGMWTKLMNARVRARRGLRRKIQGLNDSDDAPEHFVKSDEENDVAGLAARAFDELAGLNGTGQQVAPIRKTKSGLLEMKFMRDAEERGYRVADSMADDFRAALLGMMGDSAYIVGSEGNGPSALEAVQANQGRLIFRPTTDQSQNAGPSRVTPVHLTKSNESDTSRVTLKSSVESITVSPRSDLRHAPQPRQRIRPIENPWLADPTASAKLSREKNEILVSKKSSLASKSKAAFKKQLARTEDVLTREADDAVVEISLDQAMPIDHAKQNKPKQKSKQEGKDKTKVVDPVVDPAFRDSDDEGDDAEGEDIKAFEQRDLVALAFAGDNVEFTARKEREMEADAPTTVDMTVPGWGSWGGRGTKKSQPKPHLIPGVAPAARADAGKARVIISERKDKKASHYMVKDLPHPYTTKAQFESSLEMLIGPEWNTRMGFQRSTLLKVVKRANLTLETESQLPVSRRQIHIGLHHAFSCLDVDYGWLDDSGSSRHGGYQVKEARRKHREKQSAKVVKAAGRMQRTGMNPESLPRSRPSQVEYHRKLEVLNAEIRHFSGGLNVARIPLEVVNVNPDCTADTSLVLIPYSADSSQSTRMYYVGFLVQYRVSMARRKAVVDRHIDRDVDMAWMPSERADSPSSAWLFFKTMNVSGAGTVPAASSAFIGQGGSACLFQPYINLMTLDDDSRLSILVASSVMCIPAPLAISKLHFPEKEDHITRGNAMVERGVQSKRFSSGSALVTVYHLDCQSLAKS
ncbi:hypothetical protein BS47DRAFT_1386203 [Hydnum rufescens UP504]|uniref:U3 small nucleolar RNA-associated protein 14 n=1 Tax=Hydnum rufescens UP504 TaxID=1448309 RepID=A0A9P6AFJ4_9AGAM|nr:hypothetical protein BS47DRAFT_1386203 [Hydnum rufescens UP504]